MISDWYWFDGNANVRGYYRVLDPQRGSMEFERLKVDIQRLFDVKDSEESGK